MLQVLDGSPVIFPFRSSEANALFAKIDTPKSLRTKSLIVATLSTSRVTFNSSIETLCSPGGR